MDHDFSGLLVAGRYRLIRRIGKGGMGTVWGAMQEQLGREVALKLIRPELAHEPRVRERFRREAKLVAQLTSPHIVSVIDFGDTETPGGGTTLFIAMELLRGRTLRERLREGPMSPQESALVIGEVAEALMCAHAAGVVHRDLKPDNVMLAKTAQRPAMVKLVDFGVARSLTPEASEQRLTQTGVMVGTPGYLAPELVLGEQAGPASDLYSVGVMWFEMLARRQPFAAQTPLALALMHASAPAPALQALVPTVPCSIAALVDRLLMKDPTARPGSAVELLEQVEALLAAGLETTAAPTIALPALQHAFDQTRVQVMSTTGERPATPPASGLPARTAALPAMRPATIPAVVSDTRPDPHTQSPTLPLRAVPRALQLAGVAIGGAVIAIAIGAWLLASLGTPTAPQQLPHLPSSVAAPLVDAGVADQPDVTTAPHEPTPSTDRSPQPSKRQARPATQRAPNELAAPYEPRIDLD